MRLENLKSLNFTKTEWQTLDRMVYEFPNGLGASVVREVSKAGSSYGGRAGLFELAVLDHKGRVISHPDITDDVIGWLTQDEVDKVLERIAAIPSK